MMAQLVEAKPAPKRRRWQDDAACATSYAETGYDAWYGPNEDDPDYRVTMTHIPKEYRDPAKKVCAGCPVRAECLSFAMETGERDGIWGGLTPYERTALKTKVRKERAAKAALNKEREELAS